MPERDAMVVSLNEVIDLLSRAAPGRLGGLLGDGIGPSCGVCGCHGGMCGCDRSVNITGRSHSYSEFLARRNDEIASLKARLLELREEERLAGPREQENADFPEAPPAPPKGG